MDHGNIFLMSLPEVYIVRSALFGADFALKFWLAMLTIALIVWDWRTERRRDYLWVLGIGFLIWSFAEFTLQTLGIREIRGQEFYGMTLPLWATIPLQGIAEGVAVIIFGLFIGDRVSSKRTRISASTLLLFLVGLILARVFFQDQSTVAVAASRRELFAPLPVAFLTTITLFDIFFWIKYPAFRKRVGMMALTIFCVVSIWTIAQAATGNRWIEIVMHGQYQSASWGLSFFAFAFDVIVEIVLAYLPFFVIPVMAKKIGANLLSR